MIIKAEKEDTEEYEGVDSLVKQRLITAIIGIIIVVPIILYGNWPFLLISYLLATIALYELIRMYGEKRNSLYFIVSCLFLWLLIFPGENITISNFVLTKYDIIMLFVAILLVMTVISKNKFTFDQASFLVFSTLYIGAAFYYLLITRLAGLNYFLFVLFIIWATDTGAYFIGKYFGKRKLWPEISPNKTIGGAIGGIILALVVSIVFQLVYPFDKSLLAIIIITVVISIVGQLGDLVASAIKRHYNVKDSGKIFPGHGGILDRLDSLLFVLIVLYIIQFF